MTDLLHILPDFPTKSYTHLLPSLEKHLVTTTDLLTLETLEIAKRAQLPILDLKRLASHVVTSLHADLGLDEGTGASRGVAHKTYIKGQASLKQSGKDIVQPWSYISTLDPVLDATLGGGIPSRYLTEIAGTSGAGKTQFLLTLLLSSQLPAPHGLARSAIYISTEAPLPTSRLEQILTAHPIFQSHNAPPSLSRILGIQTPDLESQEHIITYQLPIAIARHNVGLVVIDSIAANYRAEGSGSHEPAALAERSGQLLKLGSLLHKLARQYDCAIVVSNQVADRFAPIPFSPSSTASKPRDITSSPSQPPSSLSQPQTHVLNPLTLDHQLRFFSGWGSDPNSDYHNLKSPSLGMVWANQLACRLVLIKEASRLETSRDSAATKSIQDERADWVPQRWRRWLHVAFAAWADTTEDAGEAVEFAIWAGGLKSVKSETKQPMNR